MQEYLRLGRADRDLAAVDGSARGYLDARLASWPRKSKLRPAIVLDIDETSLSNYAGLLASGFTTIGNVINPVTASGKAIAPTLALYQRARSKGWRCSSSPADRRSWRGSPR